MKKISCRGRRTGKPDTRELIRQCARARFVDMGYQTVTMRSVAKDAGVDVSLVSYYFGSKQGLFAAALDLPTISTEPLTLALQEDVDALGERVLAAVLTMWEDSQGGCALRTITAEANADPVLTRLVQEAIERELVDPLARRLGTDETDARARASAFSALLLGAVYTRYLLPVEPFASLPRAALVAMLGPVLQASLQSRPVAVSA